MRAHVFKYSGKLVTAYQWAILEDIKILGLPALVYLHKMYNIDNKRYEVGGLSPVIWAVQHLSPLDVAINMM